MKALTGNRLEDGEAVFLGHGQWVARFADADLFDDDDAALAAEAQAKTEQTIVVDPYLIDVMPSDNGYAPLSYLRAGAGRWGPRTSPEHGKKTEGGEGHRGPAARARRGPLQGPHRTDQAKVGTAPMYLHADTIDREMLADRTAEFREQVRPPSSPVKSPRTSSRPIRLMNGLYLQLHAYMLRIAIPYTAR